MVAFGRRGRAACRLALDDLAIPDAVSRTEARESAPIAPRIVRIFSTMKTRSLSKNFEFPRKIAKKRVDRPIPGAY
jgi:hypothetical protein